MKPIVRWFFGLLLFTIFVNEQGFSQAKIKFELTRYDFKEIKEEEGLATTIFKFENVGNKPLLIGSVKASCGCTTPIWSRDSVQPGYFGFIKVEYNPLGRPGVFQKDIIVETNGSPAVQKLTILGKVTPRPKGPEDYYPFEEGALRYRTNHLTYGSIEDDETKIESTVLYNQGKQTIKFSKSGSKIPNHLSPKMSKNELAPGDTLTLWVEYNAAERKEYGFVFDNIFLLTNDQEQQMKRINISADIKEHFSSEEKSNPAKANLSTLSVDFGDIIEGEMPTKIIELKNTGKSPLIIRKFSAACSCITLESCENVQPNESCELKITFNSRGRVGDFEKEATLILNAPSQPEYLLEIKGKVIRTKASED